MRTFTDEESKRTLEAELVGKTPDGSSVNLKLDNQRVVQVKIERLVQADQDYIKNWVRPADQVTCRVEGKPFDGYKRISIQAISGTGNTKLEVMPGVWSSTEMTLVPYTKEIKAGETWRDVVVVPNRYTVSLYDENGHSLDVEKYNRKTGLK